MSRHTDSLVSFDVPRDWDDKTIIAYTAPVVEGAKTTANLVMTRDHLRDDEDLFGYADRHVDELSKRLRGFALIGSEETEVGGRPAMGVAFSSTTQGNSLTQRLMIVLLPDRVVASFTLTSPQRDVGQLAPLFDRIMESVDCNGG